MTAEAFILGNGSTCLLFNPFALSDDRGSLHPGQRLNLSPF